MTLGPEALTADRAGQEQTAAARERVSTDVDVDVARRLRIWAALRGLPAAHVVAQLLSQAVPDADKLADLMRAGGGRERNDH